MRTTLLVFLLACAVPVLAEDTVAPAPPASMQTEYVPNSVTLNWTASPSPDVAFYRVYKTGGCDLYPECGPQQVTTRATTEELTFTGPFGAYGFGGYIVYFVTAVDTAGNESTPVEQSMVGVDEAQIDALVFASPAPNPSRGDVVFSWNMPQAGTARLSIVDLAGRTVRLVTGGQRAAGPQRVTWDGRDARGQVVRPGAYFAKLDSPWGSKSRMLVRTN